MFEQFAAGCAVFMVRSPLHMTFSHNQLQMHLVGQMLGVDLQHLVHNVSTTDHEPGHWYSYQLPALRAQATLWARVTLGMLELCHGAQASRCIIVRVGRDDMVAKGQEIVDKCLPAGTALAHTDVFVADLGSKTTQTEEEAKRALMADSKIMATIEAIVHEPRVRLNYSITDDL